MQKPKELSLDEVLQGAQKACERIAKWPQWKRELSMSTVKPEEINTDEIRKAAKASQPHIFPKGIIGAGCNRCGRRGTEAIKHGCHRVKTVTLDCKYAEAIADEIDRLRKLVDDRR